MSLLQSVHEHLPSEPNEHKVQGAYDYHHYNCDGVDDRGWGCGYRSLQTMCSWLKYKKITRKTEQVPSIQQIQDALVAMGDKQKSFSNSKSWIGSFEVCICIDYFYDVSCRIVHVKADKLVEHVGVLEEHFAGCASPVMMGGDMDCMSKCLLGIRKGEGKYQLLVLDPHCSNVNVDVNEVVSDRWLAWTDVDSFDKTSFYNLCIPVVNNV